MAVLQYGMAMPLNSDTMTTTRTHNSPNYLLFHTLRLICKAVKALPIYAIRIAKAILVSVVYVWGIITDWIVHFTVVRMLIFPLIYKIPYIYIYWTKKAGLYANDGCTSASPRVANVLQWYATGRLPNLRHWKTSLDITIITICVICVSS